MKMPKMDEGARQVLQAALHGKPGVEFRPMFGNLGAFVRGTMFAGVFGRAIFLRLSDEDRAAAAGLGAGPFEPLPGRPMKDYVAAPVGWLSDGRLFKEWLERSLVYAQGLPRKKTSPAKPRKRRK